ncbi:MAG: C1 family peptidase [Planctomycetota bacterium]
MRRRKKGTARSAHACCCTKWANRHDRWPGQAYEGSSVRGAIKGWHKHGVCQETEWPYRPGESGRLTRQRVEAARRCPLGAYFRIEKRVSDVMCALLEGRAVLASAATHAGWDHPRAGRIRFDGAIDGEQGHAFAIVGYNAEGFLVQNSWGRTWAHVQGPDHSYPGTAIWTFEDFEANVWDLWVCQTSQQIQGSRLQGSEPAMSHRARAGDFLHFDDGDWVRTGRYANDGAEWQQCLEERLGEGDLQHLYLYAHGGLNTATEAVRRARAWHAEFEGHGIWCVHFVWETGFLEECGDLLLGRLPRLSLGRAGGLLPDHWVERSTAWPGRALWREMQRDASRPFRRGRAGHEAMQILERSLARLAPDQRPRLHLGGHSAGAIFLAHLLADLDPESPLLFDNLFLLGAACTHALYSTSILPAVNQGRVTRLCNVLLDDGAERRDGVAGVYGKSLLYLVSRCYQSRKGPVPLLGLARDLHRLPLAARPGAVEHLTPLTHPAQCRARSHGELDDDPATRAALIARMLSGASLADAG